MHIIVFSGSVLEIVKDLADARGRYHYIYHKSIILKIRGL